MAVKRVIPPKDSKKNKYSGSQDPEDGTESRAHSAGDLSGIRSSNNNNNNNNSGLTSGMGSMIKGSSGQTSSSSSSSPGMMSNHGSWISSNVLAKGLIDVAGGVSDGLGGVATGINGMLAITSTRGGAAAGGGKGKQSEAARWKKMKKEFLEEMRYLSKLRHPCITTVMGAVTQGEPMLIMEYMDHGSLYDLLHNETMVIEGTFVFFLLWICLDFSCRILRSLISDPISAMTILPQVNFCCRFSGISNRG